MPEQQPNQSDDAFENQLLELSYKSLAFAGDFYDKLIYQALLADGAIAGLIINQMNTVLNFFEPVDVKHCFYGLLSSAIFGLFALFCSFMRKSLLTIHNTLTNDLEPPDSEYSFDASRYTERFFKPLPWFTCFSLWWIQRRGIKPKQPYEKATYWSLQQMWWIFCQVWAMIGSAFPLLTNFKPLIA